MGDRADYKELSSCGDGEGDHSSILSGQELQDEEHDLALSSSYSQVSLDCCCAHPSSGLDASSNTQAKSHVPNHTRPTSVLTYSAFTTEPMGIHHQYIGLQIETVANVERLGPYNLRRRAPSPCCGYRYSGSFQNILPP
ncbi:hypothetical protein STEG23_035650 [Scotinomys teguina]